jgi:hypothetical protein
MSIAKKLPFHVVLFSRTLLHIILLVARLLVFANDVSTTPLSNENVMRALRATM